MPTPYVLNNVVVLYEGFNFTSNINACAIDFGVEPQDATTFNDTTKINMAGLMIANANFTGFYSADAVDEPDDILFADVGTQSRLFSVFPQGLTDGNVGFSVPTLRTKYSPGGSVGEMFSFDAEGEPDARLIRTTILTTSTETSTGSGTSRQVGAVGATEQLYAILHVTATSGTSQTLDVLVDSDDNSGMTSATTRITFSEVNTAVTAQYATPVDGAITDDWWQATWTIAGSSPSFTFVVGMAIVANL